MDIFVLNSNGSKFGTYIICISYLNTELYRFIVEMRNAIQPVMNQIRPYAYNAMQGRQNRIFGAYLGAKSWGIVEM